MAGSRDHAQRVRATRGPRDAGCRVYIDLETLEQAGIARGEPLPWYRVKGYQRSRNGHSVIVSLYREP